MEPPDTTIDPVLVELAADLGDRVRRREGRPAGPYVVAIVGGVAVGKSVAADRLARLVREWAPKVEVVSADSFLLPNEQLAAVGGAMRKGFPESFDWASLDEFLVALRSGADVFSIPVYSHEEFDVVPGARRTFMAPEVVILEGLNLLQRAPGGSTIDPASHLDRALYLDADVGTVEEWFVRRFVSFARPMHGEPSAFYRAFAAMRIEEIEASARWVWAEINEPNLRLHIAPTRERADVVLRKGADHRIERTSMRS